MVKLGICQNLKTKVNTGTSEESLRSLQIEPTTSMGSPIDYLNYSKNKS